MTKTAQMYSLTILMKYFVKENKMSRVLCGLVTIFLWEIEGWEQKRSMCFFIYIPLDLFRSHPLKFLFSSILLAAIIMIYGYHTSCLKYKTIYMLNYLVIISFIWNHLRSAQFLVLQTFHYRPIHFNKQESMDVFII